jgi:hypothetical protein
VEQEKERRKQVRATRYQQHFADATKLLLTLFENYALDVRIDIERGRTQKADQCLIAFPRKFGSERRRR